MQDSTENCHYPELVGEPLRLQLNFTFSLEHVTEFFVFREDMSFVAVEKSIVLERIFKMDKNFLRQVIICNLLLKDCYFGSFPSEHVPTLDNDFFSK